MHTLTVTECCVNDLCALPVMTDKDHTIKQGGAGVRSVPTVYRYRAGGGGGEKERERSAVRCGAVRCATSRQDE